MTCCRATKCQFDRACTLSLQRRLQLAAEGGESGLEERGHAVADGCGRAVGRARGKGRRRVILDRELDALGGLGAGDLGVQLLGTLRRALVVAQVGFAFVLLVGAGLLFASFRRVLAIDPGFSAGRVMTVSVSLPRSRYTNDDQLRGFVSTCALSTTKAVG